MYKINFYKYQALGNDYIILNSIKNTHTFNFPEISKKLCERKFNVGADGILIISNSDLADYKMIVFNSDGSRAKMCGNGLRCLCLFIYRHFKKSESYKIETDSGIKTVEILKINNSTGLIKICMGQVKQNNTILINSNIKKKFIFNNKHYEFYLLNIGNPHCIIYDENIESVDLKSLAEHIINQNIFSEPVNISIVSILKKNRLKYRVFERGVGETLSCGTASAVIAYLSNKLGKTDKLITVEQKGGLSTLEINCKEIFLTGNANEVYKGEI